MKKSTSASRVWCLFLCALICLEGLMSAVPPAGGDTPSQSSTGLGRVQTRSADAADPVYVRELRAVTPQSQQASPQGPFDRAPGSGPLNLSQPLYTLNVTPAFYGLHYGCNQVAYCSSSVPPDVQLASSPGYILEMVNSMGEIWGIQGNPVKTFSLTSFFRTDAAHFIFDPRVTFDNSSQRWFAVAVDRTNGTIRLAASRSGDPTGDWWTYHFDLTTGTWADQPLVGVSGDKLVISLNDYSVSTNSFVGAEYWVIAKSEVLSGSALNYLIYGPDSHLSSIHPARSTGSNDTVYMTSVEEGRGYVKLFRVEGLPSAPLIFTFELPVSAITAPPNATQYGSDYLIDTGDTRVMDSVWGGGRLWLTFTDGCVPRGDSLLRSCIRLVQMDVNKRTVLQNFLLSTADYFYFYPTISLDSAGNLVVAFGYSSAKDYPGFAVWAQPADAPAAITTPLTLQAGTGPTTPDTGSCRNSVCRYGDYFASSPDLRSDSVWVAGEFSNQSGWSTKIASVAVRKILTTVPLTIAYAIVGGGSGYSPPVLTYNLNGETREELLGTSPKTYYVDIGSRANVTQVLVGSTQTERWLTDQQTTEMARTPQNLTLYYTHQYVTRFRWAVSDGSPTVVPLVKATQFGRPFSARLTNASTSMWADAGSSWMISRLLNGSDPQERWSTAQATNGSLISPFSGVFSYKHQFFISTSVTPEYGGMSSPPSGWYDSGAFVTLAAAAEPGWQFEKWRGSGLSSYSGTRDSVGMAVSGPVIEVAVLFPGVTITSSSGGSVYYSFGSNSGTVNESETVTVYVTPGTTVNLSATPSSPFTVLGGWAGNVTGAASTISVAVSSPTVARAEFGINYLTAGLLLLFFFAAGAGLSIRRRRKRRRVPPPEPASDE